MILTIPQQEIFDSKARFRTVSAGRRFGKTFLSMYEIARIARFPNKKIFYVAPSYRMGKQIIWEELKDKLIQRGWIKKINESDLTLTLKNNSRISIRSADNPDSMRGVSLDFVVLDEAAFMPQTVWSEVLRPTLSDRKGGAVFISTPRGYNWFYDLWADSTHKDNWENFQYTTVEGGNVTPEEVEDAKQDMDLKTYRQEYLASFETAGHLIYHAFEAKESIQQYDGAKPKIIHIGCDFNIDPISAVVAVKTQTGMHVIDEIVIQSSNTDELAEEILRRYSEYRVICYPDPAGSARKTSAGGRTDHTILMQYGFEVKARRRHPAVKDRINSMNKMLCNAQGERRLFIDPKCKQTITCIQKQQYKEGTMVPDKTSGYDHQNDAFGYMIEYLFPVTKQVNELQAGATERFGHF